MLRNYLKTALRNCWKNKGFSAINIVGLAIGLATCLLILFYVVDELSYDRFYPNANRIMRLDQEIKFGGNHFVLADGPPLASTALKTDYPEVEQTTRFRRYGGFSVKKGNMAIREERVVYTDSTFLDVFALPMIAGDPHQVLRASRTMVITEKIARKYFNSTDVLGRNLIVNDSLNYKITGVIKDVPSQSHFNFDIFVALSDDPQSRRTDAWLSNNYNTYILLKPGVDWKRFEPKLDGMTQRYISPLLKSAVNQSLEDFRKSGNLIQFSLMPLTSIHLYSNKTEELGANGSIQYVYIFSAIALFILVIACVNFMNLSTARSSNRAKEVGVRKVLGSLRSSLIGQFITESILISLVSMMLAVGIAWAMLPFFNQLAAKQISIGLLLKPWMIPSLVGLVLVVGVLAGSYPAFFLSAFKPIQVLKGNVAAGFKTGWLRNVLVVFQFGISIFLMVGTVVIYNQLNYIRSRKLGFNRDHVLVVQNIYTLGDAARSFKESVQTITGVEGATMTGYLPTSGSRSDDVFFLSPDLDIRKGISMQVWSVDDQYIPVLGMEMAAGRNYSIQFPSDSDGVIINEAAAAMMGPGNQVGQRLYQLQDVNTRQTTAWHVVGVVKNFNFNSLREVITPMALFLRPDRGDIAFRINTANIPGLIGRIEDKWRELAPGHPFSYAFMDDQFNSIYTSEQRMGWISLSFSVLAICIACLGLFGLAAYAAEQRTREIGIRKVLGATVTNIIGLLSRDFLRLVMIAALIAFPFAWWAMYHWLQDFAYRVSIGWGVFVLAGILSVAIAILTVSFQAVRAALANPVRSLRRE